MRKLIYLFNVSLDGYMESKEHSLDWSIIDEELHRFITDRSRSLGAFLYGRRLYETMAAYWPTADTNPETLPYMLDFALMWNSMPKIVFSKTLPRVEGNSILVREDAVETVRRLKEQPGGDLSVGGAALAAPLIKSGLVDEYELFIHPVILGDGTPMFPLFDGKIDLRFVETKTFRCGVIFLRYQCVQVADNNLSREIQYEAKTG